MTKLAWRTERRKVRELIPADYNPRVMTEKDKKDLTESISTYGEVEPVVVNTNNTLIGGHQRVSIYADLGIEEIDVRVPDRELSIEEEMRLNIRLNKNTGRWDKDKLKDFGVDMLLDVGFGSDDVSGIWDTGETEDDKHDEKKEVEKAKKDLRAKPGQLYQLGRHRLLCGDSTVLEDVARVVGEERIDVIYSDPPYNIGLDYSKGVGNKKGKYDGEYSAKSDSKADTDYLSFVNATMERALSFAKKDAHVFYWCDQRYIWAMQTLFIQNKVDNKRVCMWIKNNASPTPGVAFNKAYEPCVYGTRGRPYLNNNFRAFNEIINKETGTGNDLAQDIMDIMDLWIVKRETTQDYEHPTQKPTTLHEKPLKRCSAPGHNVLDSFGGSGSTLMACEQLNRNAFLIEKDPVFATVILNRWEKYTGKQATLIKDNKKNI